MTAEEFTEFGVRCEDGMILPRPDRPAAVRTRDGITDRGGTAALVSRRVTRTEWADDDTEETT